MILLKKLLFIMIIINLVQRFEFGKLFDIICNKLDIHVTMHMLKQSVFIIGYC